MLGERAEQECRWAGPHGGAAGNLGDHCLWRCCLEPDISNVARLPSHTSQAATNLLSLLPETLSEPDYLVDRARGAAAVQLHSIPMAVISSR